MKAISLWQPWASLIGRGKVIETRSWPTAYRGPIAIHAAKRWTGSEIDYLHIEPFRSVLCNAFDISAAHTELTRERLFKEKLPFGAIIAVATLTNCVRTELLGAKLKALGDANELAFGNYASGRWGWLFAGIYHLKEPIPYRGEQGLFNVDLPELEAIR